MSEWERRSVGEDERVKERGLLCDGDKERNGMASKVTVDGNANKNE